MKCFVTGASGFIGANLVHTLVARGNGVKALLRPETDLRGLKSADIERVPGDLSNREKLAATMRGCDWYFHVAANNHLWLRDYLKRTSVALLIDESSSTNAAPRIAREGEMKAATPELSEGNP